MRRGVGICLLLAAVATATPPIPVARWWPADNGAGSGHVDHTVTAAASLVAPTTVEVPVPAVSERGSVFRTVSTRADELSSPDGPIPHAYDPTEWVKPVPQPTAPVVAPTPAPKAVSADGRRHAKKRTVPTTGQHAAAQAQPNGGYVPIAKISQ